MSNELNRYRTGYSLGVGAVVLHNDRILLVRNTYGAGSWVIPGGYVEPSETIEAAIAREVLEETGVATNLVGLIGVRHRVVPDEDNNAYFIFLLRALSDEIQIDDVEISEAKFLPLPAALQLDHLNPLTKILLEHLQAEPCRYLFFTAHPTLSRDQYVLYL